MKHVFGYCRVSGRGQLDGDGYARQQDTIRAYCEHKGFHVVRWFFDAAVSGEVETGDRPEFVKMLELIGPATTDTVVIERADRLARTLAVCELACEEARTAGVTILEAASDTDLTNSDDPTRVLIRQVLGALAEWNKNCLVKRLRVARERMARETGKPINGKYPYGRTKSERAVIRRIVYLKDTAGYSFRTIAAELRYAKTPMPSGKWYWTQSSVYHLYSVAKNATAEFKKQIYESDIDSKPKQHPTGGDARVLSGLPVSTLQTHR